MRGVVGFLLLLAVTASAQAQTGYQRVKEAFLHGGPVTSCWNVNKGWNLAKQKELLDAGHPYFISIYAATLTQGANKENRWTAWAAENDLSWIPQDQPLRIRYHNHLSDWTDVAPELRGPFETSPLVHFRKPDGTLNSQQIVDPLGPIQAWKDHGKAIGSSLWLQKIAEKFPNAPIIWLEENNEASLGELGAYTEPITNDRDQWRYQKRKWRPALETISVRMADYALANPDPNALEPALNQMYRERYEAFTQALLENLPAVWRGRAYTGCYGELNLKVGLNKQTYSYERPQEDWTRSPWSPAIWRFGETSERCYVDGSGGPFDWDDWIRHPAIFQQNGAPLTRYLLANRPLWHQDVSFWYSPQSCRMAVTEHGGYVLPPRVKGLARASLWASRPDPLVKKTATVFTWFASSQTTYDKQWFDIGSDPAEHKHLTHGDYFESMMSAVDEVWENPVLLEFWRKGEAIVSPDPAFCDWVLPSDVVDDRSRTLYTDVDAPRFQNGRDTWRDAGGKKEIKVFAQAWKMPDSWLVFAQSPRGPRSNVTVKVPGIGDVVFDMVDQDGEFRYKAKIEVSGDIH